MAFLTGSISIKSFDEDINGNCDYRLVVGEVDLEAWLSERDLSNRYVIMTFSHMEIKSAGDAIFHTVEPCHVATSVNIPEIFGQNERKFGAIVLRKEPIVVPNAVVALVNAETEVENLRIQIATKNDKINQLNGVIHSAWANLVTFSKELSTYVTPPKL